MKHASIVLLILFSAMLATGANVAETAFNLSYKILPSSVLSIKVTTNVNSFDCISEEELPTQVLRGVVDLENSSATFSNANLQLQVTTLDCDNGKIDSELQNALNAKVYPLISINISAAKARKKAIPYEWVDLDAKAVITIHGVPKPIDLLVKGRRTGSDTYQFKTHHAINMTDHKVDPPTALLGLIKVEDEIIIHLDIHIKVL